MSYISENFGDEYRKDRLDEMKIKPCPFCGFKNGENGFHHIQCDKEFNTTLLNELVYMHCFKCHGRGPKQATEKDAIRLWNNRAEVSK